MKKLDEKKKIRNRSMRQKLMGGIAVLVMFVGFTAPSNGFAPLLPLDPGPPVEQLFSFTWGP